MNKITPEQALQNLYQASRLANLSADQHTICAESAKVLNSLIQPQETPKEEAK